MTKNEFINKIVGAPWVNRAYDFNGCDCFGLVYLYMKNVMNVIPDLSGEYKCKSSFSESFHAQLDLGQWHEVDRPTGDEIVFVMFNEKELPIHCGVMIDRINCLHSIGTESNPGQVVVNPLLTVKRHMRRFCKDGEEPMLRFYKWQK